LDSLVCLRRLHHHDRRPPSHRPSTSNPPHPTPPPWYVPLLPYLPSLFVVNRVFVFCRENVEGEQLEEAVTKQIDYYFSRQNLATDAYLVSQMDSDMWVPIATIASFKVWWRDLYFFIFTPFISILSGIYLPYMSKTYTDTFTF